MLFSIVELTRYNIHLRVLSEVLTTGFVRRDVTRG